MKAVILAGGFGTRISEESAIKPKPMIEVGLKPILWHIMSIYSHHGINDFVVCLGYKGHLIKEYFANYFLGRSDVRFDLRTNKVEFLNNHVEPWTVTLVDTGESSMTGGRLKRVRDYLDDETFCMTYGDGVSDVDIPASIEFHKKNQALCTLTAVQPSGPLRGIHAFRQRMRRFPISTRSPSVTVHGSTADSSSWSQAFSITSKATRPLGSRSRCSAWPREGKLCAYKHGGFWQSMDTLRDKMVLEELWAKGDAPWALWSKNR